MTKVKFFTPKFKENAANFLFYFLAVAVTPLLGALFAPIWDWAAYGFLRELFGYIHTGFFWLAEVLIFRMIMKKRKKKRGEIAEPKQEPRLLPWKNVAVLTAICVFCVLLVSAVIGFQVKPFYDVSRRGAGFGPWCEVGKIGLNFFKCMWIVAMIRACKNMSDEIVRTCMPQAKPCISWVMAAGMLMLFGIFDIFAWVLTYTMVWWKELLLALVYVVFYNVFVLVHYLTEQNNRKSFLLTMFIYLF